MRKFACGHDQHGSDMSHEIAGFEDAKGDAFPTIDEIHELPSLQERSQITGGELVFGR